MQKWFCLFCHICFEGEYLPAVADYYKESFARTKANISCRNGTVFFVTSASWGSSFLRVADPKQGILCKESQHFLQKWYCLFCHICFEASFSRCQQKSQALRAWLSLRRDGDSNPGYPLGVRLFSKQVLSASQAPLHWYGAQN